MEKTIYLIGSEFRTNNIKESLNIEGYTVKWICNFDTVKENNGITIIAYSCEEPKEFFEYIAFTHNLDSNVPFIGVCWDSDDDKALPLVSSSNHRENCTDIPIPVLDRSSYNAFTYLFPSPILAGIGRDPIIPKIIEEINRISSASNNFDVTRLRMAHAHALEVAWSYIIYQSALKEITHGQDVDFANILLAPIATGYRLEGDIQKKYFNSLLLKLDVVLKQGTKENSASTLPLQTHLKSFFPKQGEPDNDYLKKYAGPVYLKLREKINIMRQATDKSPISDEIYTNPDIKNAVLDLLYDCARIRSLAGFSEQIKSTVTGQGNDLTLPDGSYKIVVIDDHAKFWQPYFEQVVGYIDKKNSSKNIKIDIIYSEDGENICDNNKITTNDHTLMSLIPDCDLIFIDVMLGGKSGLDILNKIRAVLPIIPIVIISTKNDPNMFNKIQRANAFVYKKNLQIDTIAEMVVKFLSEGLSRRHNSLPNPFFNNNIINKDQDLREPLLNFTNFTIKHLDGFHGLDNHYFRYFNNHGGRHMIALMHILEHLLRPFLLAQDDELGLNTKVDGVVDLEKRKTIILSLYLAVLTHEFGMFPLGTDDARIGVNIGGIRKPILIEDYSKPAFTTEKVFKTDPRLIEYNFRQCMDVVRKFHGARSMMMLIFDKNLYPKENETRLVDNIDENKKHPLQYPEFRKIWQDISEKLGRSDGLLNYLVATIAGYHNRFLSLHEKAFLQSLSLDGKEDENVKNIIKKNLNQLNVIKNTTIANLVNEKNLNIALKAVKNKLDNSPENAPSVGELQKICAVFRFADALDIDYSRAIPSYLGYPEDSNPWEEKGYTEDLKKYIVHHVGIDCGVVTVYFNFNFNNFDEEAGNFTEVIFEYIKTLLEDTVLEDRLFQLKHYNKIVEFIKKGNLNNDKICSIFPENEKLHAMYINDILGCFNFLEEHSEEKELLNDFLKLNSDKSRFKHFSCYEKMKKIGHKKLENMLNDVYERLLRQYCATSNEDILPILRIKIQSLLCAKVMLELFDEYEAIVEVGLADKIQFGQFKFIDTPAVDFNLLDYMRDRYRS